MKRNFPNWLTAYNEYTALTEAPAHFHLWVGMWCISSVLGRKVWIDMGAFDWVPNQYIVFIGEPGIVTKSTSIRLGEELVRMTDAVKFGSNSSTWQKLAMEMQRATVADYVTATPTSTLTLGVSELGSFLKLDDREQVDFLVDIWDGHRGVWQRGTVGGGEVRIERPCLNLIAGTTPSWIRENFQGNMVGGGLSSRMILVLGKEKRHLVAYPGLDGIGLMESMKEPLVEDLKMMSELVGTVTLTPEAVTWGREWYASHILRPDARQLKGERYSHYYARKQTHMHKIAIILSVAQGDTMKVTKKHLQAANGILLDMEKGYAEAIEHVQSGSMYSQLKIDLHRVIASHGDKGVAERDLYKEVAAAMSGRDFAAALRDLIKAEEIREIVGGSSSRYRSVREVIQNGRPDDIQNDREELAS